MIVPLFWAGVVEFNQWSQVPGVAHSGFSGTTGYADM